MNTYNFDIDFTNGKIYGPNFLLVMNDHNSTTFNFTFDQKGRYVFKLLYPDNTIYVQDIVDGKIVLTKGVLNQEGNYKFEVCLYGDDNRLTTARIKEFPVRHELVETDEPVKADDRLPILDNLIEEANKVVEDAKSGKFDGATFTPNVSEDGDLSWSNDKGKENPPTVNIKGPTGEPGAVKMQVVDSLPEVGRTDTIYLVKKEHPTEQNLYEEYIYTETSGWEHIGDTSVDLTDYYTREETDEKLDGKQDALIAGDNITIDGNTISASGGEIMYVINLPGIDPTFGGDRYSKLTDTEWVKNVNKVLTKIYNMDTQNNYITILFITNGDNDYPYYSIARVRRYSVPTGEGQKDFEFNLLFYGNYYSNRATAYLFDISIIGYVENKQVRVDDSRITRSYNLSITPQTWASGGGDGTRGIYMTEGKPLGRYNIDEYTPTQDYHPATKKYVDDCITALPSSDATKTLENQHIFFKRFDKETYPGVDDLFIGGTNDSRICEYFSNVLNKMAEDVDNLYDAHGLLMLVLPNLSIMLTFDGFRFSGTIVTAGNMLTQYDLNLSYEENNGQYTVLLVAMGQSTPNVDMPYYEPSITPKSYVDTVHYTQMTGYDESKTQILKNINGTLTWVDET